MSTPQSSRVASAAWKEAVSIMTVAGRSTAEPVFAPAAWRPWASRYRTPTATCSMYVFSGSNPHAARSVSASPGCATG